MEEKNKTDYVLVVDDAEDNRIVISRRLVKRGYEVREACDGTEALRMIEDELPALVLLDYMMPGLSGIDVLSKLREKYSQSDLPVIMVTARAEEDMVLASLDAGANDFVPKPIAFKVLLARIAVQMQLRSTAVRLSKMNEELEETVVERTKALQEETERARLASRAKSEFLASMSHEIRTPMNGVIGMAEVLANTELNDHQKELASIIVNSGNALMSVINDVLDFSKLEAGKMSLVPGLFNFRKSVEDVVLMMRARAAKKDLELIVRYAPGMPEWIVADEMRLRQIVVNLVGNAVKFTEFGSIVVDVAGERDEENVHFTVSVADTGIGIPEAVLPKMFEKFVQADGSYSRKYEGTGLGLAICKDIVDLMGGDIQAESELGNGSRFFFSLDCPFQEDMSEKKKLNGDMVAKMRVMAIDDNKVNRVVLSELLSGWGIDATVVESTDEAFFSMEKALDENRPFTLLITDFLMPREHGIDFTARLRRDERFCNVPVIVFSSVEESMVEEQESNVRIDKWLNKPIRPSDLMDSIATIAAETNYSHTVSEIPVIAETDTKPAKTSSSDNRVNILICEDNHTNRLVLQNMICRDEYNLTFAENGEIGVRLFKELSPAMVMMDISMPVMDGLEATAQIREYEAQESLCRTPIVATTAHVLEQDRDRCRIAGMDDFIGKPVRQQALEDVLDKWIMGAIDWSDTGTG